VPLMVTGVDEIMPDCHSREIIALTSRHQSIRSNSIIPDFDPSLGLYISKFKVLSIESVATILLQSSAALSSWVSTKRTNYNIVSCDALKSNKLPSVQSMHWQLTFTGTSIVGK